MLQKIKYQYNDSYKLESCMFHVFVLDLPTWQYSHIMFYKDVVVGKKKCSRTSISKK